MKFHLSSVAPFIKNRARDVWSIVDDALINNSDTHARGRRGMLFGNYTGAFISPLISGIYFTGLMLYMGATESYIGTMSLIGSIVIFTQLFAPLIIERLDRRKNMLLGTRLLMHFLNIVVMGLVPALPIAQNLRLGLFMVVQICIHLINNITGAAYNVWHMQSVPLPKRANYFTLSSLGTSVISVATTFVAGLTVDGIKESEVSLFGLNPEYFAFLLLRAVALLLVFFELRFFNQIPEYPYEKDPNTKRNSLSVLLSPLKNADFMKLAFVVFIFNILASFLGNYYSVYLLKKVEMSYTYISLASMLGLPMTIIFTPIWAKLINKYSWFKMLIFALIGYLSTFICNTFTTASTQYIYIISNILCYIVNPCVTLNWSNIQFVKMPPTNQTAFCSFYSVFTSIGSLVGIFLGNQFFRLTEGKYFMLFGLTITNYQWMTMVQFVLMVALIIYIAIIRHQLRKDPANASLNL